MHVTTMLHNVPIMLPGCLNRTMLPLVMGGSDACILPEGAVTCKPCASSVSSAAKIHTVAAPGSGLKLRSVRVLLNHLGYSKSGSYIVNAGVDYVRVLRSFPSLLDQTTRAIKLFDSSTSTANRRSAPGVDRHPRSGIYGIPAVKQSNSMRCRGPLVRTL